MATSNDANINIKTMTPDELQNFQGKIEKIRQDKIVSELVKIKNEFVRYCKNNNLELSEAFELAGFTNGGVIRKTKAKYKDPISGKLWAGRGKTPHWYLERIKEGMTEEQLLIK